MRPWSLPSWVWGRRVGPTSAPRIRPSSGEPRLHVVLGRAEDEVNDTDARLWHPWLRINRVLRVMLYTQWSAEAWAEVRLKFQAGTHVAGQIRCDDVELRHAIYSATNSVFSGSSVAPAPFPRCNS
jgi:hypothetical protein